MSVYKMVEVVGTSGTSVTDAIQAAVNRAAMTLEDLEWFEVKEIRGRVNEGEVAEYQVKLDLGFLLHAPQSETGDVGSARQAKPEGGTRRARSEAAQVARKRGQKGRSDLARSFKEQPRGRNR